MDETYMRRILFSVFSFVLMAISSIAVIAQHPSNVPDPSNVVQAGGVADQGQGKVQGQGQGPGQGPGPGQRANPFAVPVDQIPARDTGGGEVEMIRLDAAPLSKKDSVVSEQSVTAEIAALQTAITTATDLTEEVKSECVGHLDKTKQWVQNAKQKIAEREQAEKDIASAPSQTTAIRNQLLREVELPTPEVPKDATVVLLESRLNEMRQQVEAAEAEATAAQQATETRASRLNQLSKDIQEVEQRMIDASAVIESTQGDDLLARSKRLEQQARLLSLNEKLPALKTQRSLLDATGELMPLKRDLAVRTASATKKQLLRWEAAVSNWRKDESQRQAEQARRIAEQSHPALRSFAIKNAEVAELRIASADGIQRIAKSLNEIDKTSSHLEEQFEDLRGKVEHAGATTSTGILLRKQRGELPSAKSFAIRSNLVSEEMPRAHLRLMELKQLRRDVTDVDEAVANLMQTLDPELAKYDPDKVQIVIKRMLSDRRILLDKAIPDQDTYLQELNQLDLANKAFERQVNEIRLFLDQHVLWMRSNETLSLTNLRQAANGLATLLTPARWGEVVRVCIGDLVRRPAAGMTVLTLLVLAILFRAKLLSKQKRLCELPPFGELIKFSNSIAAFALTFVISVRWPLLLSTIGYRAQHAADATPWTQAVGAALFTTILFVWGFELISELSSREGIGERLFGWSSQVTASLRGTVETSLLVGAPLFAILQLTHWQETPEMENLQRVMFIAVLLFVGLQIAWLVRPSGKLMATLREQAPNALVYRLRQPIWILSSAAPLAFAGMSVVGYHFSAFQLSGRLAEHAGVIVAVIVLYSLALSWVKSKAYNREVQQILDDAKAQQAEQPGPREEGEKVEKQAIRAAASQETQDLLRYAAMIGLVCAGWIIWSDVLPALRVFDQVEMWQNLQTVSKTVVGADGLESIETFEQSVPTTLTNVLAAIVMCIATFVVSRRLPALLDLTVLDRLPLDNGGRQAIAILVRYAATLAGMLFACHAIKLSWESVQWLAAAMTVGLGFGLQEIFANLVSGLIILFERPIRAGDLVTVDNVTGHVTRMQIRATTITDFDRREFIVPNKRFITDNVINWTLSDPISRIVIPVGVAYGTDSDKVHEILMRIARCEPLVLNEPPPATMFKGFGDSTLDFDLRVFIPQRDIYVDVMNRINGAIAREFHKAGVEIAFPQLDLHLKGAESILALNSPTSESAATRVDAGHQPAVAARPLAEPNRTQRTHNLDAWSA